MKVFVTGATGFVGSAGTRWRSRAKSSLIADGSPTTGSGFLDRCRHEPKLRWDSTQSETHAEHPRWAQVNSTPANCLNLFPSAVTRLP
jgi:nucleoside-diphosphate-sugar epimerase